MTTFNEGLSEKTGGKVILVKCSIVNICLHFILFSPKSSQTLDMLTTLKKKIYLLEREEHLDIKVVQEYINEQQWFLVKVI